MERLPGIDDMFELAEALHVDVDSIMKMPSMRLTYWRAHYNIKDAERKRSEAQQQVNGKVRRSR